MSERDVHQELIDNFKGEPLEVINKRGFIRNNKILTSMGYRIYCPYSVVGEWDMLEDLNKVYKEHELFKEKLRELDLIEFDYNKGVWRLKE